MAMPMQHSLRVHQEQVASPVKDEHYQVSARHPLRPIRVKTGTERTFITLGLVADAFLWAAAAASTSELPDPD